MKGLSMIYVPAFNHAFPILLLVLFQIAENAETFSYFNRYDLSYQLLESHHQHMTDTGMVPWFSLHGNCTDSVANTGFIIQTDDQTLTTNLGVIAGLEYFTKSNCFGVISGDIAYRSPFLKAYISTNIYSTEWRVLSPTSDIQFERFIKENAHEPIVGMFDFRANLPEAYLETIYKSLTLSLGKQKLRWGPGYKGTLGLSGTAYSPFYFYHLNIAFGNILNMKAFLCGYDDESIYRGELTISEKIVVTNNKTNLKTFLPRYGAGQRLDIRIGKFVQLGVYELVDFFGSNEFTRFVNPLQFYFLSNEASGTNNANLLGGLDFNIIVKPFRFYGEFVNDDITVFEQTGNPDKYALQLGAAYYGHDRVVTTGLEYTHLSQYIYGHSRVLSRHSLWGESLGWPWGNNQDIVTAYAIFSFPYKINAKVEANYWLKGDSDIENDWYADGKPDLDHVSYSPEHATRIYSAIFSAEYTPYPWLTYSIYWEPVVQHKKFLNGVFTYLLLKIPGKRVMEVD
jgi:hypothetical protein